MSGTSMDGIDAAVVTFDEALSVESAKSFDYPDGLKEELHAAVPQAEHLTTSQLGRLDKLIGAAFATACDAVLKESGIPKEQVKAVGSHGQTVFHAPEANPPFTLQLGDPTIIANRVGLPVVADFRRMDMTVGGQGAPLAPGLHQYLFGSPDTHRVVANIGGIANITVLPKSGAPIGFDTGPGNTLMNAWISHCKSQGFDEGGRWALSGKLDPQLLDALKADPYFQQPPPKSTGPEYFNLDWMYDRLGPVKTDPEDIQRVLLQLTADTLAEGVLSAAPETKALYVCGGGAHNGALMQVLSEQLPSCKVESTVALGLHPDWVEAVAFAWLARQTMLRRPGNIPSVTGAGRPAVLGMVCYP